jgi:hypothetical protein
MAVRARYQSAGQKGRGGGGGAAAPAPPPPPLDSLQATPTGSLVSLTGSGVQCVE